MAPHQEFLELCAVSVAGELTGEERKKLNEHLETCSVCRRALDQFKISAKVSIPAAADEVREVAVTDPSVSLEKAEAAFLARFDEEGGFKGQGAERSMIRLGTIPNHRVTDAPSGMEWGQLWMPLVAIVLCGLALGIASYRLGMRSGGETGSVSREDGVEAKLEEQLSDAGHEREQFQAQVAARDRTIADLRKEIQDLSATMARKESGGVDHDKSAERQSAASLAALQGQLATEQQERSRQAALANDLEAKVQELSKQLQENQGAVAQQKLQFEDQEATINRQRRELDEREGTINRQQDLLAHDRDVRELMGARDLYVAEVYDIAYTGETNKPYGRIFYTRGKSLIFYAYDLNQEPGLQEASTFQAWGQRGPDKQRALNLGIFYVDNAAKKRWVLKFNDAKTLTEIDAVFVTVEPDAHARSPRGKQVLFSYLRINPNHP